MAELTQDQIVDALTIAANRRLGELGTGRESHSVADIARFLLGPFVVFWNGIEWSSGGKHGVGLFVAEAVRGGRSGGWWNHWAESSLHAKRFDSHEDARAFAEREMFGAEYSILPAPRTRVAGYPGLPPGDGVYLVEANGVAFVGR